MSNFVVSQKMAVTGKTTKKTNVFWSTVPENEQFRNVLVPGVTSAAKEVNNVFSKPQKQVQVGVKKSKSDPVVSLNRGKLALAKNAKLVAKQSGTDDKEGHGMSTSLGSSTGNDSRRASLRNLNAEDKKRVANLIKELAKTGEERELALERLQEERVSFEERLAAVQEEQTALRLEKEVLQQKLRQGEVQLKKYEQNMSLLRQQKSKQELIMRKQTSGFAQGTQTSPKVESASTSADTSVESTLDVNNNNLGGPQIPVYTNKLFDLKVVKDSAGPEKELQIDAREGSRLQELYLREYKLQLDLQEKQLEIQRQQVLLQKQLNTLLPTLQSIGEQQQENGTVGSGQNPPEQFEEMKEQGVEQSKQNRQPLQNGQQGTHQQLLNKQLPGSPKKQLTHQPPHTTQPFSNRMPRKTITTEQNSEKQPQSPNGEHAIQNSNSHQHTRHTPPSRQTHELTKRAQTKDTRGPPADHNNNNVNDRSPEYQMYSEEIGSQNYNSYYKNTPKQKLDTSQTQNRSSYKENERYADSRADYQLYQEQYISQSDCGRNEQPQRTGQIYVDQGSGSGRHKQPVYSGNLNTDINKGQGGVNQKDRYRTRNTNIRYGTHNTNIQSDNRHVRPDQYDGRTTDINQHQLVNNRSRDHHKTDYGYIDKDRRYVDKNEYGDVRTGEYMVNNSMRNKYRTEPRYIDTGHRNVDMNIYVDADTDVNHHRVANNHLIYQHGTAGENTRDYPDIGKGRIEHRSDHPNKNADAKFLVVNDEYNQNRIHPEMHGRYNMPDDISHGGPMHGDFERNQHYHGSHRMKSYSSPVNGNYGKDGDQIEYSVLYGRPYMRNPNFENHSYIGSPEIHHVPDRNHENETWHPPQFRPTRLDGGNMMSPRRQNSGQPYHPNKHLVGTYHNDQRFSNGELRDDHVQGRYVAVPHVLTNHHELAGRQHSPQNPGLLDQYISNHKISHPDKMNVPLQRGRNDDQITLTADNHGSPTSLNMVEHEAISRNTVAKLPEEIERTAYNPNYSLHDPKSPQASPRITRESGGNRQREPTGSPNDRRQSPMESHQKPRRIPEYCREIPVSPPYRGGADVRSDYPNSLIEFVEDLEINEELAGNGPPMHAGRSRVFLNSEEEENSVLSDIFFRNM